MLQINSKVYQYALKKINSFANTMQISPNLDRTLLLKSFVLHRISETVQFSKNMEALRIGLSKLKISLRKLCKKT